MRLNSLALIAGKMATMGLGFLVWLVAARLFAAGDVGLASATVSAMMLCVQLGLFGAGAAVIVLLPGLPHRRSDLLDSAIIFVIVAALLAGGIFLVFAGIFLDELRIVATRPEYAVAFLAMCVFGTIGVLFDQTATVLRRGDHMLVRNALFGVATLAVLVGFPKLAGVDSPLAILGAWVGGGLVGTGLGYAQLRRAVTGYHFRGRIRLDLSRQLTTVGMPNWLLTLVERAPGAVMPIAVTELISPETNAAWYAAWMIAWVVYVIPIQVGLSQFAEAAHRPADLSRIVWQGIRLSLGVGAIGAVSAAVLGPFMLALLGTSYAETGTTPLRLLILVVFPFTFIQAYYAACRARNRLGEATVVGLLSGSAGVGAAVLAGVISGVDAMAVAWLCTQVITGIAAGGRLLAMLRQVPVEPVHSVPS
jgi:O-antigen/teichoic acid export membrane protein